MSSPQTLFVRVEQAFAAGLTADGGFLPKEIPPAILPPPFDEYVSAVAELPARYHGSGRGVRKWLDRLFSHVPEHLEENLDALTAAQTDKLFAVLSVLGHAYRWDTAPPRKEEYERTSIVLPPGIRVPWASLACRWQVPRVGNLYSMVLCNFQLNGRPEGGAYCNDEIIGANLEIAHPWLVGAEAFELRSFLLAPIETEARGATVVRTAMELLQAVTGGDAHQVVYLLDRLRVEIGAMGAPFREFIQKKLIKPDHFLTLIQPTTIWGLDEGDGHGPLEGASGPQVGAIQTIDALLGVRRDSPMGKAILRSRAYMPVQHRRFVEAMESASRLLPDFVEKQNNRQMTDLFNECLEGMETWRRVHQVRGAIYLKGETADASRAYMSTGGVVAIEDERIAKFKASMEERAAETVAALLPEVPLDAETGLAMSFQYLTAEDREALMSGARRVEYAPDNVIVAEGVRRAGLYLVQAGIVRVVRRGTGPDVVLARLSAGELFGEMSFLENETTSASIEAEGNCVLNIIPREQVFAFCREREGFAGRFYQSLATLLSRRLGVTSELTAELWKNEKPPAHRGRPVASGRTAIPERAKEEAAAFRVEIEKDPADEGRVMQALNRLCAFVQTGPAGLGADWPRAADHLFKECFPVVMRSAIAHELYQRSQGHACGSAFMQLLHAEPSGDDPNGLIVDRWLRQLPTIRGLAENHQVLSDALRHSMCSASHPMNILAIGAAPLEFLCEPLNASKATTAVALEWDADAARATQDRMVRSQLSNRVTVVHDHIIRLARRHRRQIAQRFNMVLADQLFHFVTDEEAIAIFDWVNRQMVPGGRLIFSAIEMESTDQVFFECLLDWAPKRRDDDEVRRLIAESSFRDSAVHSEIVAGSALRSFTVQKAVA